MTVLTTHTRYKRVYESTVVFEGELFDRLPDCWLRELLAWLARNSAVRRYGHSEIKIFHQALTAVLSVEEAQPIFFATAAGITRGEIFKLFELAQLKIVSTGWTEEVRRRSLSAFRQRILDYGEAGMFEAPISRETVAFRERLVDKRPRPIISDLVGIAGEPSQRAPIDAMTHKTVKELEENAIKKLDFDLQRIIDACIEDLKAWGDVRKKLISLSERAATWPERVHLAFLNALKNGSPSDWARNILLKLPPDDLIGEYVSQVKRWNLARPEKANQFTFVGSGMALKALYPGNVNIQTNGSKKVIFLPTRIHPQEFIAVTILLMIYTGWNFHALLGLTSDRIQSLEGGYEVQGFKSKTDDDTPVVIIDKTHRYGIEAINLLLWNAQQLKSLGRIDSEDTGLWYCYSTRESEIYTHQYVGFQNAIADFCDRHSFVRFSYDQIRAQVLFVDALSFKNPENTRRRAGHKNISTTGVYLDQEFARRLMSANNLEFQRRFENTVKYRMSLTGNYQWIEYDEQFVDTDMMIPVGDGTLCSDPENPPESIYLYGGLCDGRRCHSEGGCPNRRIVLDKVRLEELVRKRRYYQTSWQRLARDNPDAFNTFHAPAMLFNFALYAYVKEGPYGHVLRHIEGGCK